MLTFDLSSATTDSWELVKDSSGLDACTVWPRELKQAIQEKQLVHIPPQESWKIEYLNSLLSQLQVAKQLVQENRIKFIQGLIDGIVL